MSYEIVLDSTCDLGKDIRKEYGIYEDFLHACLEMPGNKEARADLEWENYSIEEYFKIVKSKPGQVKTAFATLDEFERVVTPILKAGKDVMIFVISSGISGTVNGYRSHANIVLDDFPDRKIEVIDTLKYSAASGLLAIEAAKNKAKGMSFEDNVKWCNEARYNLHEIGPMDDLRFLAKNGRIAAGKAFFGQLAGVQPVADFTRDGMSKPLGTVKGADAANKISLKYLLKVAKDLENQTIIIAHSCRKERAELFKKQLLDVAKPKEVVITSVGQSCGANIGPGLCVYFFFGEPLSEDGVKEAKLFTELKGN